MVAPHSIERNPTQVPASQAADPTPVGDITKAARFTLISMPRQSIGRLAMKYMHLGTADDRAIAFASSKKCFYGPRFARMDRFSQTFVMAHETMHHALAHIEHGAILYKRDPKGFSFKIYNIACDAIINWILEHLPDPDKSKETIKYGVRRCQELGIVNWLDICREMRKIAAKWKIELHPVFEMMPNQLTSVKIYHGMMRMIRQVADVRRGIKRGDRQSDLVAAFVALASQAAADPAVIFQPTPVELGAIDLYDAAANLVRTYLHSTDPQDWEQLVPIPAREWHELVALVLQLADLAKNPAHIFTEEPRRRSAAFWADFAELVNAFKPNSGEDEDPSDGGEDSIIDQLADDLNAHDDLREAIEEASQRGEGELLGEARRIEDGFRRVQAGVGSGDVLKQVCPPDGFTKTPWEHAMRRMVSSALITRIRVDPLRPSRRMAAAMYEATRPGIPDAERPVVIHQPRVVRRDKAKRCIVVLDTSGSMFCDRKLLENCIKEMATICKRVNTVLTVIFADAEVCGIVEIGEAYELIRTLQPKGGGATDFRPAIELAVKMNPDLIVYLTDLCGVFPEKKPRVPIIWGYPPEFARVETPYGQRLPLAA